MMNKLYTFIFSSICLFYFSTADGQIVISELNYHSDSTQNAGDWVELWNNSGAPADISGWKLVDGNPLNPPFVIPNGTSVPANGRLVLADNLTRFDALHPGVTRLGPLGFEFSNSGEMVTLTNNLNQIQIQFMYDDSLPWNKCADGLGRTLELIDPAVSPAVPTNWRCGCIKGSPGAAFSPCSTETLLVSEINYNSLITAEAGDWIEIWNKTNGSVNLSGYKFRDQNNNNVYTFPGGTTLNPQERIVLFNDAVNFAIQHPTVVKKVGPFPFGLNANGDAVRLYNSSDRLIQSVWFEDDGDWYKCADGEGATLELLTTFDQSLDISDYTSWFCGCPKGSPGTAFINSCGIGIDDAPAPGNFKVWPNPAADVLYVEMTEGTAEYKIISMEGKTIQNGKLSGEAAHVDVSALPAGMYIIALAKGGEVVFVKWLKH